MCPNIEITSAPAYCEKVQSCLEKATDAVSATFAHACARVPEVHMTRARALSTLTTCKEVWTTMSVRASD